MKLEDFIRKMPRFKETSFIKDVLLKMQESRVHMAVVTDKQGRTTGLVTMEDILEEIVGELRDEYLIWLVNGAILMIIADLLGPKEPKIQSVDQMTYKQALSIGLIQCLSLWPGFSRSGSTISGDLRMSHRAAADFTFIMAVPIMLGASGLCLLINWQYFTIEALPFFAAGFITSFIFALISIRFFLQLINRIKLMPFAIYRIALALVVYLVYF